MPNIELLEKSMPVAPIRIAALEGCRELAEEVDRNLVKFFWSVIFKASIGTSFLKGMSPVDDINI